MKTHPIIGLTSDWKDSVEWSSYPTYIMRHHYCDAISAQGGTPIILPFDTNKISEYLDVIDGLLVTGGNFDVDPKLYGDTSTHETVQTIPQRTNFEFEITKRALKKDMPILGICGGHQLLNVAAGGTLIQHIPDAIQTNINHEQPNPRHEVGHEVDIQKGTKLASLLDATRIGANSAHHQAVDQVGGGFVVNAIATDGVIEGIESTTHTFCLGIQWHPEFEITSSDTKIFEAFIESARG